MNKLTKQSPLFDIINRINELVGEFNASKTIYQNFKPNIKSGLSKKYDVKAIPATYNVEVMGLYKIELVAESATVQIEIYRNGKSQRFNLSTNGKKIENAFLTTGDRIVLHSSTLKTNDTVTITLDMNILESFVDQYEISKNNIQVVTGITETSKKQFEEMTKTINSFYTSINFQPVSERELKELLNMVEA